MMKYHVSAGEGSCFRPRDPFRSAPRNCDNPEAQGGENDLSKVTGGGKGSCPQVGPCEVKERMSEDVNKWAERAGRGCSTYDEPRAEVLCVLCSSTKHCSGPVRQSPAEPVAPVSWTSTQPGPGLWGRAGEGGRGRGGNLKIVPISFLQLSFTVRKRARGLPAPVYAMPYIMGDTWASLQAGNRQGRDIYAALPKLMSSSREPRPWKQPPGWRKQLSWLTGAPQQQPLGWGEAEGEQGAGRKQAGAAVGLLREMAVGGGGEGCGKCHSRSPGVALWQRWQSGCRWWRRRSAEVAPGSGGRQGLLSSCPGGLETGKGQAGGEMKDD